jgi:antitoxin component of RelBE/YafQ-DinJ toxin-antitoxin module
MCYLIDMKVIYIRIDNSEKQSLEIEARSLGMTLTTYCRMVLIKSLDKERKNEK